MSSIENRQHGIAATYNAGCKCGPCTAAIRKYMAEYRRRTEISGDLEQFPCPWCGVLCTSREQTAHEHRHVAERAPSQRDG